MSDIPVNPIDEVNRKTPEEETADLEKQVAQIDEQMEKQLDALSDDEPEVLGETPVPQFDVVSDEDEEEISESEEFLYDAESEPEAEEEENAADEISEVFDAESDEDESAEAVPYDYEETAFDEEESTIFTKRTYDDKPVKEKTAQHKRIAVLISAIALVAVAVFGIVFMKVIGPKLWPNSEWFKEKEDTSTEKKDESIEVFSADSDKVKSMSLKTPNGDYDVSFEYVSSHDNSTNTDISTKTWELKGVDKSNTDSEEIESLVSNCSKVTATKELKFDENQDYGFENPSTLITVNTDDESGNYTLTFGNQSPDKSATYLKYSGKEDKVYLIDDVSKFTRPSTDFANLDMIDEISADDSAYADYFDENSALTDFDSMSIGGTCFNQNMTFGKNPYESLDISKQASYVMTSPTVHYITEGILNPTLSLALQMQADGVFAYSDDAETLKTYGLDNPYVMLNIKISGFDFSLKIGEKREYTDGVEYYPVWSSHRHMIFRIKADNDMFTVVDTSKNGTTSTDSTQASSASDNGGLWFVGKTAADFYSKYIFMDDIQKCSSIEFISGDTDLKFDLHQAESAAASMAVTRGSDSVNISVDQFTSLFQHVCLLTPFDYEEKATSGTSYTIKVKYTDSSIADKTIEFRKITDGRLGVYVDGCFYSSIVTSYVKNVFSYASTVYSGGEIPDPLAN